MGVLTTAREHAGRYKSPLLDISYRRRQLALRKKQIQAWQEAELAYLADEVAALGAEVPADEQKAFLEDRAQHIAREAVRQEKEALRSLGNNFWKSDPSIAPLRGALATWGLTIDDLDVASFHGTSTKANDKNESSVICQQLAHLGRQKGNAVLGIFQKYLTGHPKGAAGAWMMNGCLQVLNTGLVPGNRNADNVDAVMEQFDYIVYPSRSLQTDGIKAFSVTSFGFGQKGAQAIGVHPRYLYATLDEATFDAYCAKRAARQKKAYRTFHNGMINNSVFVAKNHGPYSDEQLPAVLLNPDARVAPDRKTAELTYPANFQQASATVSAARTPSGGAASAPSTLAALQALAAQAQTANNRVGIDLEDLAAVPVDNDTFLERNFTAAEIAYCRAAPDVRAAFAGRWSAKEAVFKSLGVASRGAGAPLLDIEILRDDNGAPTVQVSP